MAGAPDVVTPALRDITVSEGPIVTLDPGADCLDAREEGDPVRHPGQILAERRGWRFRALSPSLLKGARSVPTDLPSVR